MRRYDTGERQSFQKYEIHSPGDFCSREPIVEMHKLAGFAFYPALLRYGVVTPALERESGALFRVVQRVGGRSAAAALL